MATVTLTTPATRIVGPTTYFDAIWISADFNDPPGTWPNLRAGYSDYFGSTAFTAATEYALGYAGSLYNAGWYEIDRWLTSFDTSSVPATAEITSATLTFRVRAPSGYAGNQGTLYVHPIAYSQAEFVQLLADDILAYWEYLNGLTGGSPAGEEAFGPLADDAYVDIVVSLAPSAITPAGLTQLGCFLSSDWLNNQPAGDDRLLMIIGTGFPGSLSIVYVPSVTFSFTGPNAFKLMGADATMEFSLNGGVSWIQASPDMNLSAYFGQMSGANGIRVRYIGDTDYTLITLQFPPTGVTLVFTGAFRYLLYGTTDDMEYSIGGGYTTCSANVSIEPLLDVLVPATGVIVRYIAFPDDAQTLSVAPTTVTFSFDGADAMKLMGSDDTMEYSLDGGATYTTCTTDTDLTEFLNTADWTNDIKIRYIGAIVPYVIDLAEPPAAPDVEFIID